MKNFSFTINGSKYDVEIQSIDGNIGIIEVNGTQYEVELHNKEITTPKTPKLVRAAVTNTADEGKIKKSAPVGGNVIKTPLPGTVVQIFVNIGDKITVGQKLMTYDAMKMENNILSEMDGVIKSVQVAVGDNMVEDQVLFVFE